MGGSDSQRSIPTRVAGAAEPATAGRRGAPAFSARLTVGAIIASSTHRAACPTRLSGNLLGVVRVNTILLENNIRIVLLLLASLVVSLVVGSGATYLALETLPCHWFGTGFEGACAYGAIWAAIGIGVLAAVVLFAYLGYRVLRRRLDRTSNLVVNSRAPKIS